MKYHTGPFNIVFSLRLLKEQFTKDLKRKNLAIKHQAKYALQLFKEHPKLETGFTVAEDLSKYTSVIEELMVFLFPPALADNELKVAVTAYSNNVIYCSNRMQKIINHANSNDNIFDYLFKDHDSSFDLVTYAIILNKYYQYQVDFDRPKTLTIADKKGVEKKYRVTFNADFLDIYPNENAIEITQEVLSELLANADDEEIWKKYFPKNSWTVEGFGLINLIDTSLDEQIDAFKTHLIEPSRNSFQFLNKDLQNIFNLPELQVGSYGVEQNKIIEPYDRNFKMLTIDKVDQVTTNNYACDHINQVLFKDCKPINIANVELYHKKTKGNRLSNLLLERGIKSVMLIPITIEEDSGFIVELATKKVNQLNAINMVKLETIMPFILSYSKRSVVEYQNEVSAVIQQECTSIHSSVEWRFEEEASKYIQERNYGTAAIFEEVVFKDVLPLYGQVDIVGSSNARNKAIQKDLTNQLEQSKAILQTIIKKQNLPFYEQLVYKIDIYLTELNEAFHSNSEQEINLFFEKQLFPLFEHLLQSTPYTIEVTAFMNALDSDKKTLYNDRKKYDSTVDMTNKVFSSFIDKQQVKAQKMFPHYFEKFKTDGIEHNMYIGQSLVKNHTYHSTSLYNLRLWQLQVTCEMEAMYYDKQKDFPLSLEVASLILAYDIPITIRYRMDEKQFDVDGAYNVRYEMIKKRIDKAHIKNTNQRLTQPHMLSVVYSSNAIEREYLAYFEFLQSKNYIGKNLEIVELEELQGASGLKAIRADMNHQLKKVENLFKIEELQTT